MIPSTQKHTIIALSAAIGIWALCPAGSAYANISSHKASDSIGLKSTHWHARRYESSERQKPWLQPDGCALIVDRSGLAASFGEGSYAEPTPAAQGGFPGGYCPNQFQGYYSADGMYRDANGARHACF